MSKEFKARRIGTIPAFEIFLEGGGPVPAALSGHYTSENIAMNAVRSFQAGVRSKVSRRGKKQSK